MRKTNAVLCEKKFNSVSIYFIRFCIKRIIMGKFLFRFQSNWWGGEEKLIDTQLKDESS